MTTSTQTLSLDIGLDAVMALSERYDEPAWMQEARRDAWALYQELPLPHNKEEAWRRIPLHRYPLESLRVAITPDTVDELADLPPCWLQLLAPEPYVGGSMVHCNGAHTYATLRAEDIVRGVVFEDLHRALHTHGDLIRNYWMKGTTARVDFNKFTALNAALWHGGTFVYVPEGVRVSRTLQSLVGYDGDGGTALHHTLVIAEKGSRLNLIQDRISQEREPQLNVEVVEIYAEAGAWVRYVGLQHWGEKRWTVGVQNARLARDANLVWISGALGGQVSKEFLRTDLSAPGARGIMQGFTFARDGQHIDQSTYQHHQAADTYSDLLFRNVLRGRSRTVFYGMIRVEPEAQHTQGYQASNNLLLDDARAHAIPGLEIIANDVKCSHGATVSRIDREQLFYLQSRGLPRADAERLIVQGFLQPIVEQVPLAHMRERLSEEIVQRFVV